MRDRPIYSFPDKPCALWEGAENGHGYGVVWGDDQKPHAVHRLSCEFFHGPPPEGKNDAMHSCDVRNCYEPSHLKWGSRRDNMRDAADKGRVYLIPPRQGMAHHKAKLSDGDVRSIRRELRLGRTQVAVAAEYGISQAVVSKIKLGLLWAHVEESVA